MACLIILVPVVWILVVRLEGEKPTVKMTLASPYFGLSQTLSVSFSDSKSGLRKVWIGLLRDGKESVLFQKEFPGSGFIDGGEVQKESTRVIVEPKTLGIPDGKATLRIVAWDFSWRGKFRGNRTVIEKEVTIDTKPPSIAVLTRFHNIAMGGAGLAIYRISESCPESGIYVAENFFPGYSGYFKDTHIKMAFFALNYDQGSGTKMFVQAVDAAGNRTVAGLPHYIIKKSFKKDVVNISDRFLAEKMPEFDNALPSNSPEALVEAFLKVNNGLRKTNYGTITELVKEPDTVLHWNGRFLRLPNSARRAGFADHRVYRYKGKDIDRQVHLGIDLASIARSPVRAANGGKVIYAGSLGIYGDTVLIDHGFGLFSMYSHLSEIQVQKGQMVGKKDVIGRTGSTGLAGGDHLHFGMLVHHMFVNPIEWWDTSWIENNVLSKIRDAESG